MDDWVEMGADEAQRKRERAKARELRKNPHFQEVLRRGVCYYCHKKFPPEELTLDHIVPVARGGKSTKGNLVVCCKECNNAKKYLTPAEILLKKLESQISAEPEEIDHD